MRAFARILVVWLIAVCAPSASATPSQSLLTAGTPCPVTTAPPGMVAPPPSTGTAPNPTLTFTAGPGSFLYGNDALIVILPNDGILHPSDPARGLPGGVKFPWWRGAHGDLAVATRRLDADTSPQPADVPGGYGDTGFQVSGLNFPAPGCWQVTGTISGRSVTFVVNVAGP